MKSLAIIYRFFQLSCAAITALTREPAYSQIISVNAVSVKYKNGVLLNYSANFSTPYEGYRLAINGTHGRLEALEFNNRGNDALEHPWNDQRFVEYYPIFGGKERVHVLGGEGGHGGGDPLILEDIFLGEDPARKFDILAKSVDGLRAIAIGDAVFKSIEDGTVQDLTGFMR